MQGYDNHAPVVGAAAANIERAGLSPWLKVNRAEISSFTLPEGFKQGLIICNPPYGERLGEIEALSHTYQSLGAVLKTHCPGWTLGVFTGNKSLGQALRLRPNKRYAFFNGTIASELLLFELLSAEDATLRRDTPSPATPAPPSVPRYEDLSEGAQMVANRLRKNLKKFAPWVKQERIDAYRLYDADLPEYAAAIDLYHGRIHLQEYAPPKSIDEAAASKRLNELIQATSAILEQPASAIALKTRQRNKGKLQYEKRAAVTEEDFFSVEEGRARLWVNLTGYLDTGLFLDHRPLRLKLAETCFGKRFLNLFCYTATASVHAILGGASRSISVDMSHTYLNWAQQNFTLNGIHSSQHQLVQADCLQWLKNCREGFDVIMLDPPSFSNSKRMDGVLDVQRDHVALIQRCMELLRPQGVLYFSTNLRSFKLDEAALSRYAITPLTEASIPPDFARNPKIHHCYRLCAL